MGKAYAMVRHELTLDDIIAIRSRSDVRLTTSPFGITPGQYERNPPIYVAQCGRMTWKKHPENMPPAVRAGLAKAQKISKACAGIKGTVLYNGKLYPAKCIAQKKAAGKLTE
jgi:hypothetical protein